MVTMGFLSRVSLPSKISTSTTYQTHSSQSALPTHTIKCKSHSAKDRKADARHTPTQMQINTCADGVRKRIKQNFKKTPTKQESLYRTLHPNAVLRGFTPTARHRVLVSVGVRIPTFKRDETSFASRRSHGRPHRVPGPHGLPHLSPYPGGLFPLSGRR